MSYGQSYGGYGSYNPYAGGYYGGGPPPGGFGGGQGSQYGRGPYGGPGGAGGGFAAPQASSYGMPPGADPQLWSWFTSVDLDRSGFISPIELEHALIHGDWTPVFKHDTVKILMTNFDTDRKGTINFSEFADLWKYIKDWQHVFKQFDRDRSGAIDGGELRNALAQYGPGYSLSPPLLDLIQQKYAAAPVVRGAGIAFPSFIRTCVVVKQIYEAFGRLDTDCDGWIHMTSEQFMHTVLSLP